MIYKGYWIEYQDDGTYSIFADEETEIDSGFDFIEEAKFEIDTYLAEQGIEA